MVRTVLLSLAAVAALPAVAAEPVPQPHPAVVVAAAPRAIDPSTFIVGHPASPRWGRAASANGAHPAVIVAHRARTVDANTFLVQPPASVTWTAGPAAEAPVVAAAAR